MIQFSYWLFPAVFLVFAAYPPLSSFLLPGLLAACAAGAANGAATGQDLATMGHGLAASLFLYMATRRRRGCFSSSAPCGREGRDEAALLLDVSEAVATVLAWGVLAALCCALISDDAWPYVLSRWQMMSIFGPFLVAGVSVRR